MFIQGQDIVIYLHSIRFENILEFYILGIFEGSTTYTTVISYSSAVWRHRIIGCIVGCSSVIGRGYQQVDIIFPLMPGMIICLLTGLLDLIVFSFIKDLPALIIWAFPLGYLP